MVAVRCYTLKPLEIDHNPLVVVRTGVVLAVVLMPGGGGHRYPGGDLGADPRKDRLGSAVVVQSSVQDVGSRLKDDKSLGGYYPVIKGVGEARIRAECDCIGRVRYIIEVESVALEDTSHAAIEEPGCVANVDVFILVVHKTAAVAPHGKVVGDLLARHLREVCACGRNGKVHDVEEVTT